VAENKPNGAAYGSVGLSVAAIVLVTTLMPIIMGGSVALAIVFGVSPVQVWERGPITIDWSMTSLPLVCSRISSNP